MERRAREHRPLLSANDLPDEEENMPDRDSCLEKWMFLPHLFSLIALAGVGLNIFQYINGDTTADEIYLIYYGVAGSIYTASVVFGFLLLGAVQRQDAAPTTAKHHFRGLNMTFSVLFILSGIHKVWVFVTYDNPNPTIRWLGDGVTVIHYISEAYLFVWLLSNSFRPYSTDEQRPVKKFYRAYLIFILAVNLLAFSRLIFVDYTDETDPETVSHVFGMAGKTSVPFILGSCDTAYRFLELSYILKLLFHFAHPLDEDRHEAIYVDDNSRNKGKIENTAMRKQRHAFYVGLSVSLVWATMLSVFALAYWSSCNQTTTDQASLDDTPSNEKPSCGSSLAYLIVELTGHAVVILSTIYLIRAVRATNAWTYESVAPHIQMLIGGALIAVVFVILFIIHIITIFREQKDNILLVIEEFVAILSVVMQVIFVALYYRAEGTITREGPVRYRWMLFIAFFIGYHLGMIFANLLEAQSEKFMFNTGFEAAIFTVAEVLHVLAAFMCIDVSAPTFLGMHI